MGNLDSKRDWDMPRLRLWAMWLILQQEVAEINVIATGVTTKSLRELPIFPMAF